MTATGEAIPGCINWVVCTTQLIPWSKTESWQTHSSPLTSKGNHAMKGPNTETAASQAEEKGLLYFSKSFSKATLLAFFY